MKYMVQFKLRPGVKNQVIDSFELRGPNRNPGVKFLGAWIGNEVEVVFALLEASDDRHLAAAGASWGQFGEFEVFPVTDVEQY
ncbi:MAG: DUF3303 family protein [Planctomycetia bacterium]|nr:DUF3303 family protein [Planctomycetia bacterium]